MNHTPAPWTIAGREIVGPQDSGVIVARLPEWGILADGPDPAPANARLIAAAPDLLAALQWWLDQMQDDACDDMGKLLDSMTDRARAAIAAARGDA